MKNPKKPTEMTLAEIESEIASIQQQQLTLQKDAESLSSVEKHNKLSEINQLSRRCKNLHAQRVSLMNHELVVLKRYLGKPND